MDAGVLSRLEFEFLGTDLEETLFPVYESKNRKAKEMQDTLACLNWIVKETHKHAVWE